MIQFFLILFILIIIFYNKKNPKQNRELDVAIPTYHSNKNNIQIFHTIHPFEKISTTSRNKIFLKNNKLFVKGFISKNNPEFEIISIGNKDKIHLKRTPWIMKDNTQKIKKLFISVKDNILSNITKKHNVEIIHPKFSGSFKDIWLRDEFKVGYMDKFIYILNGPRNKDLDFWIDNYCKNNNLNHFHIENGCANKSYNYFGNLICLNSKTVLYGINERGICKRIIEFINNQKIQKIIHIDTSWLAVGHVDEIVTVLPDGKIGMISPALAVKQLKTLPINTKIFLANKIDTVGNVLQKFGNYNLLLDKLKIEPSRKILKPEINLPVLFYPNKFGKSVALTFNLANIIVDPRFIIAPINNGPIVKGIPRWGNKLWNFYYPKIDLYQIDSNELHYLLGGLHCASNEIR